MKVIATVEIATRERTQRLIKRYDRAELEAAPREGEWVRLWSPSGRALQIERVLWHLDTGEVELSLIAEKDMTIQQLTNDGWRLEP